MKKVAIYFSSPAPELFPTIVTWFKATMPSDSPADEASNHLDQTNSKLLGDQTNIEEYYMNLLLLFIGLNVLLAFLLVFFLFWAMTGITKKTAIYAERCMDLRDQVATIEKQCKTAMNRLDKVENSRKMETAAEPMLPGKPPEMGKCPTKTTEQCPAGKQFEIEKCPTNPTEKFPAGEKVHIGKFHTKVIDVYGNYKEIDFKCVATDIHIALAEFCREKDIDEFALPPIRNDAYAINKRNFQRIKNMRYNLIKYCEEL